MVIRLCQSVRRFAPSTHGYSDVQMDLTYGMSAQPTSASREKGLIASAFCSDQASMACQPSPLTAFLDSKDPPFRKRGQFGLNIQHVSPFFPLLAEGDGFLHSRFTSNESLGQNIHAPQPPTESARDPFSSA